MTDLEKQEGDTTRQVLPKDLDKLRAHTRGQRASFIVLAGWEIGRELAFESDSAILGRSPVADLTVALPSVSRQHARFERTTEMGKTHYFVHDLGSMNGTLLNGNPVTTAEIQSGDKLQMGDVVLKFMLQDAFEVQFHKEVHRRIHYNDLTGLLTIESFRPHLERAITETAPGGRFTVAMTDLDGLKQVNDTFGHPMGSLVIQEMGAMIREVLRPDDRAGLFGGDEAIMLYSDANLTEAKELAERLRSLVEQRQFCFEEETFRLTISQGLAEYPAHGVTCEQLIAAADGALYAAKAAGRNCVRTAGK
jgi:diguanylate cyclase (GGDEF)-like protein